jgi:hypothetical protein
MQPSPMRGGSLPLALGEDLAVASNAARLSMLAQWAGRGGTPSRGRTAAAARSEAGILARTAAAARSEAGILARTAAAAHSEAGILARTAAAAHSEAGILARTAAAALTHLSMLALETRTARGPGWSYAHLGCQGRVRSYATSLDRRDCPS